MIKKLLIANRGDIAVRVIRTAKEMGIKTVAVYSEIDKTSYHVAIADEAYCIGPNTISKSYNSITNIVHLAMKTGCDAIHPGFGFLAENPEFVRVCEENNIKFVGPSVEHMSLMGNKSKARETVLKFDAPVVPGSDGALKDYEDAVENAKRIGYPVMIKASAGGGGKGMRIVEDEFKLKGAYNICKSESKAAFGDDTLYMEKFIVDPRHIEVQVFGDSHGNALHFGDRDCSMQRRNQKVIEESLSPYMDEDERNVLYDSAIRIVKGLGYEGAGTVEFVVDKEKNFYFIEMNTRIQVEHPVSEMISGFDLIRLQLEIASGLPFEYTQDDIEFRGHAIECRINAEDANEGFIPSPGKIESINIPGGFGVRFDTFVYPGYVIPPVYDSMIGKLICHAPTREECISKALRALDELKIEGITTNIDFHKRLLTDEAFINDCHHTKYIENELI